MSSNSPEINIGFDASIYKWTIDGYIYGNSFFVAADTIGEAALDAIEIIAGILHENSTADIDDEFRRIIGDDSE